MWMKMKGTATTLAPLAFGLGQVVVSLYSLSKDFVLSGWESSCNEVTWAMCVCFLCHCIERKHFYERLHLNSK